MYEELIRRLREEPLDSNKAALTIMDLCIDAAAAIENLSHTLDMAQGERDAVTKRMIELEQEVGRLREERDAAIADLRKYLSCGVCSNGKCYIHHGTELCNFKYRGLQKEA